MKAAVKRKWPLMGEYLRQKGSSEEQKSDSYAKRRQILFDRNVRKAQLLHLRAQDIAASKATKKRFSDVWTGCRSRLTCFRSLRGKDSPRTPGNTSRNKVEEERRPGRGVKLKRKKTKN